MNASNFQNPFNGQLQNFNVQGSHDAVVIDINQDGNKDLFIATCEGYHMFVSTFDPAFLLGDVNQNGDVSFADIAPFVALLTNGEFLAEADFNGDGVVSFADIPGFIALLTP